MTAKAKWTFMVYIAGDNSLGDNRQTNFGLRDLREMRQAGSSPDVNIVVQYDDRGRNGTRRYRVERDGLGELEVEIGEADSGSPEVLNEFIAWAAELFPAERYALVLWSHGGGWEPSELDAIARSVGAQDYQPAEAARGASASQSRPFFRTSWERIFELPSPEDRWVCSDDGSGHSLDTIELGKVLASAHKRLGQPVDLLGMDACLMSSLEVACQVQPHVRYLVASEEEEPGDGWPYDAILRRLVENPEMDADELGSTIVTSYVQYYVENRPAHNKPVTQAALDLGQLAMLTDPLDRLADLMATRLSKPRSALKKKIDDAHFDSRQRFRTGALECLSLWDVGDFAQQLRKSVARDKELRLAVDAVRAALEPAGGSFVVAESHEGVQVAPYKGVTVYMPRNEISQFYGRTEFARQHRWAAMLDAYFARS